MRLCFVDLESTSLRPDRRAWEVAVIVRDPGKDDVEHCWFVDGDDLDLGNADLGSLKVGRFHDRHPHARLDREPKYADTEDEVDVLAEVEALTRAATVVGIQVDFDMATLDARMRANGICPSWSHRIVDARTLAAGAMRMEPPWGVEALYAFWGVSCPEEDRHTALGDARFARDLYDRVFGIQRAAEAAAGGEDPTAASCAYCSEPIRFLTNEDRWQHLLGNQGHVASPAPAEPLSVGEQAAQIEGQEVITGLVDEAVAQPAWEPASA